MTNEEWVGLGALAGVGVLLYASSARDPLYPVKWSSFGGSVVNAWLINNLPERERDQLVQLIEGMGRDPNYLAPVMSSMDRDWNIWKWVDMDGGTFTYTGTAWVYEQ